MALSKSSATYNKQNWEDSEFPILCQTCLGDNPYVRMMKDRFGAECKICNRPFTTYRWCPGVKMRFKKTEVCQTCSRLKNVCQTCLLDLEYGLPVAVRDKALRNAPDLPTSNVNREYFQQQVEKKWESDGDKTSAYGEAGKWQPPSDMLMKMSRSAPYYRRNAPHICSFWVKGECKRGETCPYRHEKPTDPDDPLSDQNLKDRFYGVNDPVADKLLRKYDETAGRLEPPADPTVSTLYVGGISQAELVTETDLRNTFYQFGEIRSVHVAAASRCAFVEFARRSDAERAANALHDRIVINGQRLVLRWARGGQRADEDAPLSSIPVPGLPGVLPAPSFTVDPTAYTYSADSQPYSNSAPNQPGPSNSDWRYPAANRPGPSGIQSSYAAAPTARHAHRDDPQSAGAYSKSAEPRHAKPYYPSQDPNRFGGAPGSSSRSRYGK